MAIFKKGISPMYKKVIVPIDLSAMENGERILRNAVALLDQDGEVIILNVVEELPAYLALDIPNDLISGVQKEAEAKLIALKAISPKISQAIIRNGAAAREILEAAEQLAADLIIIGSHKPDFTNYFIGATADRVVRHAKCSVLVDR